MASRRKNVKKGVQFTIMVVGKQPPNLISPVRSKLGRQVRRELAARRL
jgi:septin family protein